MDIFIKMIYVKTNFERKETDMDKSRAFKKGSDFEMCVYLSLNRALKDAFIMHGIHIPFDPSPAQIDLLVVCGWSFHILELKNYEYCIKGSLEDKRWIAMSNTRTYKVQNPIMQNTTQTFKFVQKLRNIGFTPPREIKNYVIVPDTCRIDVDKYLLEAIITIDTFITIAKSAKEGSGDIKRLREVLTEWKKYSVQNVKEKVIYQNAISVEKYFINLRKKLNPILNIK